MDGVRISTSTSTRTSTSACKARALALGGTREARAKHALVGTLEARSFGGACEARAFVGTRDARGGACEVRALVRTGGQLYLNISTTKLV